MELCWVRRGRANHVIMPIRLILADRKECSEKTNGFGQVRMFSSCDGRKKLFSQHEHKCIVQTKQTKRLATLKLFLLLVNNQSKYRWFFMIIWTSLTLTEMLTLRKQMIRQTALELKEQLTAIKNRPSCYNNMAANPTRRVFINLPFHRLRSRNRATKCWLRHRLNGAN